MRKYILTFCALCLGLVSCVKEDMSHQDGQVVFNAGFSHEPSTKTVLQELTPHWTPADVISVYDGKNNMFVNTDTKVSAKTSFKGKLEGQGRKYYLAAYPYHEDLSFAFLSKSVYGMQMPVEQTAIEGTYDPKAATAIAYTLDFNLSFKNVCSLIKFRIISDGVKSVTVRANAGEDIAGMFNATWGDSPDVVVTAGEKEVTLKGEFKKDQTYYITTLPAVLKEGITVILNGTVVTLNETYQIDLARSGLVDLGSLSLDPNESKLPEAGGGNTGGNTGGEVEGGRTIYLNAGGSTLWDQAGAWFEVWSWKTGAEGSWYSMKSTSTAGIYECSVPQENSNIIFVRRGPGMTQGWDAEVHYWNKTDDLAIPAGSNCYTITGWGGKDGTWSTR